MIVDETDEEVVLRDIGQGAAPIIHVPVDDDRVGGAEARHQVDPAAARRCEKESQDEGKKFRAVDRLDHLHDGSPSGALPPLYHTRGRRNALTAWRRTNPRSDHLDPADRSAVSRAPVSTAEILSPARSVDRTSCGRWPARAFFCSSVAGASIRSYTGSPRSRVRPLIDLAVLVRPEPVISAARGQGSRQSLSIVQTVPIQPDEGSPRFPRRRNPALPSRSPSTNPLNPTGTSKSRQRRAATRSMIPAVRRSFPGGVGTPPRAVAPEILDGRGRIVDFEEAARRSWSRSP